MERAIAVIHFNRFQIEEICRKFFKDGGCLEEYEILEGAINTVYKILWNGKPYVLRFYARKAALAQVEKAVYTLISKVVPVPEWLFSSVAEEKYSFAIFRYAIGKSVEEVDNSYGTVLSYQLGEVLAKIHRFSFPVAGLFGKGLDITTLFEENSSPDLEYCLKHLVNSSYAWRRLGSVRAKRLRDFLDTHREFFPIIQNGGVLVHSDFKPGNILWDKQRGLTVLDWEFAHVGHKLTDFGTLLRYFRTFPLDIGSLEKGYRENGGELVEDWIKRARVTDLVNGIQLLNSTEKERPKFFTFLLDSIDFTLNKWENLDSTLRLLCKQG